MDLRHVIYMIQQKTLTRPNISRFRSGYIIGHQFDYNDTAQQDNAFFECNDVDKITFCAVA